MQGLAAFATIPQHVLQALASITTIHTNIEYAFTVPNRSKKAPEPNLAENVFL